MPTRSLVMFRTALLTAFVTATALWAAAFPVSAEAAAFKPERPVTLVNVNSPGGGSDVCLRALVKVITDLKLSPVDWLVEYHPGGSGARGYSYVANNKGDDHTLALAVTTFFTTPLLGQSPVNYKNFTPVASLVEDPYVLVVAAKSPITSLEDIKKKKSMLCGVAGIVSDPTLIFHTLARSMGLEVDIVPHQGAGEAVTALLGGHVEMMFSNPGETMSLIQAGELRPIVVCGPGRLPALPNVPTLKELGYDVDITNPRMLMLPLGVSQEAVVYWTGIIEKAVASPNWKQEYLDKYGVLPKFLTGEKLTQDIQARNTMYAEFMKLYGLIK